MQPKFSLQNVLDLRHDRVEALEVKLGGLIQLQVNTQGTLDALLVFQANLMTQQAQAQMGDVDLVAVSLLRSNLLSVDQQILLTRAELSRLAAEVEKKRSELVKARQDEETLQTLKRRRIEFFNAEQAQREAKTQDDIYIAQAYRQRSVEAHTS
jgi:flagellar export protein FliJ